MKLFPMTPETKQKLQNLRRQTTEPDGPTGMEHQETENPLEKLTEATVNLTEEVSRMLD